MNSRERVNQTLAHREPDRIPIGIGGSMASGLQADVYVALQRYLGLSGTLPKVYDQFQMLARVDEPVRQALNGDIVCLENPVETWGLRNTDWKPWTTGVGNAVLMPGGFAPVTEENGYLYLYQNGNRVAFMPSGGLYFERTCSAGLSDDIVMMDPEAWKKLIPLFSEEDLLEIETSARKMYEETECAVFGGFGKGALSTYGLFAGHTIADWMMLLMMEPDYASAILSATAERAVENAERYIQAAGKYIDIIFVSGFDFGIQDRELFRPSIFHELYLPSYKRINDYIHTHCRAKIFFHSCGSISNLIEDFIAAGVDILNPVQTTAAGMDPATLKAKYGDRITFWGGGVDTQTVLPFGTREQVRRQVKERIKLFGPGGGFIFSQIHNLQPGVPPENIMEMVETVLEYGRYPIAEV